MDQGSPGGSSKLELRLAQAHRRFSKGQASGMPVCPLAKRREASEGNLKPRQDPPLSAAPGAFRGGDFACRHPSQPGRDLAVLQVGRRVRRGAPRWQGQAA
jgi:hypothetical protein